MSYALNSCIHPDNCSGTPSTGRPLLIRSLDNLNSTALGAVLSLHYMYQEVYRTALPTSDHQYYSQDVPFAANLTDAAPLDRAETGRTSE